VNKTLKSLYLADNKFSHLAGKQLGAAIGQNETLETLDLSWNQFREGGAAKLLEGVKDNIGLKTLNLAFNAFNHGACKPTQSLGTTLSGNSTLRSLDVSNNRLSDSDLFMVAKGIKKNETLEILKIGQNVVSYRGTAVLIKVVVSSENCRITLLDMTDLPIAKDSLSDVEILRSRGVKVVHGPVHQTETKFDSESPATKTDKKRNEKNLKKKR
ncbi:unnamed protein product, partial [Candidula unifasciata]